MVIVIKDIKEHLVLFTLLDYCFRQRDDITLAYHFVTFLWLYFALFVNVVLLSSGDARVCTSLSGEGCQNCSFSVAVMAKGLCQTVYCKWLTLQ